jgi:hypothetical protein
MSTLHVTFGDLSHAVKLRHGTDGFTSPPKEGEGFFRPKNPMALAGCEPAYLGTIGQHATSKLPKSLVEGSNSTEHTVDGNRVFNIALNFLITKHKVY